MHSVTIDQHQPSGPCDTDQPAADERSPIHREVFQSRCFGNLAFATALLDELRTSGTTYVDQIARHAEAGALNEAADAAHSLKGAAAIVGAQALSAKAAQAEALGRDGELQSLKEVVDQMREELQRCLADADTLRAELPGPDASNP